MENPDLIGYSILQTEAWSTVRDLRYESHRSGETLNSRRWSEAEKAALQPRDGYVAVGGVAQ